MSERKYLPLNEDRHNGIDVEENHNILAKASGGMKFIGSRAGSFFAIPFMLFNAVTTVAGVTLILPAASGLPIGIFLSTAYILITISEKIKREHPLRRLVLLYIFAICSAYTSFFSIYEQMSETKLEHQAVERTVGTHNDFINNLRVSLNKEINDIAENNPNIGKIKRLNDDLLKTTEQRAKFDKEGKDKAAGELASRIKGIKRNIESLLTEMEVVPAYQFHQKLLSFQAERGDKLKTNLSIQNFIQSNQTPSELFAEDASLYRDIFSELDNVNANAAESNFGKTNKPPKYDDYLKTPIFLIPFESLVSGANRQVSFMMFAIVISILMEIIPLLLSGIVAHELEEQEDMEDKLPTNQLLLPPHELKDLNIEQIGTGLEYPPKGHGRAIVPQTPMDQVSKLVSSFVFDLKKLSTEISHSWSRGIGTTEDIKTIVDRKLHQSMASAHLHTLEEQYKFLVLFYESIHREDLEISLYNFPDGKNLKDELFRYKMAAALFISVMRDKRIGWLKKSYKDEKLPDRPNLGGEHGTDSFEFEELFKQRSSKIKKWQFVNEAAYQDFLDWWLKQQHIKDRRRIEEDRMKAKLTVLEDRLANRDNNGNGAKSPTRIQ
jgi:hypothetical protein